MSNDLQQLQEFINFAFDLPDTYLKAKADGKFDFMDIQFALPIFGSAQRGIEGLGNPLARWKALDEDERSVLLETVKQRFDISDNILESLIERWLETGMKLAELVADTIAYTRREEANAPATA